MATDITSRIGIRHPIIQGPFGGGVSTPKLVAAVNAQGGLGSYGCYTNTPAEIEQIARDIRAATDAPFGLNLWVSNHDANSDDLTPEQFDAAWKIFEPFYAEFGLPKPQRPPSFHQSFEAQIEALIEARPAVFSFIFGIPKPFILAECRRQGITTMGAATSPAELEALDSAGVDIILANGFESGGHRPSFLSRPEDSLYGTLPLTAIAAGKYSRPIASAGGIANRAGVNAVLAAGASAAQIGTAFLACEESGAPPVHRDALLSDPTTILSRVWSGRLARGIPNKLTQALAPLAGKLPAFPVENWFTVPLRRASAAQGRPDFLALYSGQGAPLLKHRRVADLMADLTEES